MPIVWVQVRLRCHRLLHQIIEISRFGDDFLLRKEEYCEQRDCFDRRIASCVANVVQELKIALLPVTNLLHGVRLMSSYGANTNLVGISDVDNGVTVKELTEEAAQEIGACLTGYSYTQHIHGHYCFNRIVKVTDTQSIEIAVKVRDLAKSRRVMRLHEYLDNECDTERKNKLTYLKYLLHKQYPKAYKGLKVLFYNICLLKINPDDTEFFKV